MYFKLLFSFLILTIMSACQLPESTESQEQTISTESKEATSPIDPFNTNTSPVSIEDIISQVKKSPLASDNSYTQCLQQSLSSCESQAVYIKVQNSGNTDDCNLLSDEYDKNTCKDNIVSNNALKNKSTSECNNLKEEYRQQQCKTDVYRMLARENLDTSYCSKIAALYPQSESTTDESLALINTGNFGEQYEQQCQYDVYMEEARQNNDSSVCNKIDDTNMKDMCKQTFQYFNNPEEISAEISGAGISGTGSSGTGIENNSIPNDTPSESINSEETNETPSNTSKDTKTRGVPKQ